MSESGARPRDAAAAQMFIDGRWCAAADGRRAESVDPATGRVIGDFADGGTGFCEFKFYQKMQINKKLHQIGRAHV